MAETKLLEKKQILETEARMLKIKEKLAKAKAKLSVYHNIPADDIQIKQQSAQQRWEYQREKNVKACTSKLMCSNCKGNHPTPLHGYVPKDKRSTDGGDKDPKKTEEALKIVLLA